MISIIIVVLLALITVFWKPPFSMLPIYRFLRRRWRWMLLVILLISLFAAQTHTSTATANLNKKKAMDECAKKRTDSANRLSYTETVRLVSIDAFASDESLRFCRR
jgi:hypothetical protein